MITDIVLFVGGIAALEPFNSFMWLHHDFWVESGLVRLKITGVFPPLLRSKDIPTLVARPDFAPLARQRLEALTYNRPARPEVLLISDFQLYKKPRLLALRAALCRHFFPAVRQRAIFVASPADREVEAICSRAIVRGRPAMVPLSLRRLAGRQQFLEKRLTMLEAQFGKDALTIIPYRNEEQLCRGVGAALAATLPGDIREKLAALSFTPSKVGAVLPRDLLDFMSGVNQLFAVSGSGKLSPFKWRKFGPFLRGGTGSTQLLSPEARAGLQRKFDAADIEALARRNLPPWTRQKNIQGSPFEPFTGLTDDEALRLASLLPQGRVGKLLNSAHLPEQYRTYGARQCLRALQKTRTQNAPGAGSSSGAAKAPQPRVAVLTTSYRQAGYIAQCIESVIAQQTDFPIQHIIADDGSDDGTQDIIMDYAARYPHIVPLLQKVHPKGSENLRSLMDMARTEYVALCDGDDYFTDPYKLQSQVDLLDANLDYALCFHIARVVYEGAPERERLYPPEDILPRGIRPFYYLVDLLRNNFIQTNAVMYRWRFKSGLPDWFRSDLVPGDRYWHLLHAQMGKIGFINKVMSVYRRHGKSLFHLSEIDALQHRAKRGMREVEVWNVINQHFDRKYESIIRDMVNHIFADCLLYDTRQEEEGSAGKSMLEKLSDKYPDFARHFLASLKQWRQEEEPAP